MAINFSTIFTKKSEVPKDAKKNLSNVIAPVAIARLRHDIQMWRDACNEAEQGFAQMRHRVKMQRMFVDTVLNEHVDACIRKRKRQILQKEFSLCTDKDVMDENWTKAFKKASWFSNFLSYVIDAPLYGYTLVSLGNVVNSSLPELTFIRRTHISPDRLNVATFEYSLGGTPFLEGDAADWHIYIDTPTETGVSPCGYGLLYKIAKSEILLRNNTTYNADYNEMYGMPIRKGKTMKTDEKERGEFFQALVDMAHKGAILLDDVGDDVELVESGGGQGTGWKAYENFEQRLEKKISKVILGHADAIDSVPGKLGSTQGEESPAQIALREVETEDSNLCEDVVNTLLLPRLRSIGFSIPENIQFKFLNNKEKDEIRQQQDKTNKVTADIANVMKLAGLQMDPKYFEERTGIPTTIVVPPLPPAPLLPDKKVLTETVKNKLNQIYNQHRH
jgi:hypothetical protein